MNISLRKAIPTDIEWLDPFYESLMRPYVELTHEWDTELFRKSFTPETTEIIQLDGKDIGMMKLRTGLTIYIWVIYRLKTNSRTGESVKNC